MTKDLDKPRNDFVRALANYDKTTALTYLAILLIILSCILWFRTERAMDKAVQATATATTWQTMYKETERECRLAQLEIDDIRIVMIKAGLIVDHVEEKP